MLIYLLRAQFSYNLLKVFHFKQWLKQKLLLVPFIQICSLWCNFKKNTHHSLLCAHCLWNLFESNVFSWAVFFRSYWNCRKWMVQMFACCLHVSLYVNSRGYVPTSTATPWVSKGVLHSNHASLLEIVPCIVALIITGKVFDSRFFFDDYMFTENDHHFKHDV